MNHPKKQFLLLLISILFLTGCAQLRQPSTTFEPISWKKRQTELRQIKNWTVSGALSITYNKKRDIARIKWAQTHNNYDINISAPLNISSIRIVGDENHVELWRSNKNPTKAKTPEELTLKELGWQLPVSNIRYWILGLPAPKTKIDASNFDQYGHLTTLYQSGWQIKYLEFGARNKKNNVDLPRLIELKNAALALKLKITDFVLESIF